MSIRAEPRQDLGALREARRRRLRIAKALYGGDPDRAILLPQLAEVLALVRADRAGVVWLDGSGYDEQAHAYALLDLGNDRPDRAFAREPLIEAAALGPPGLVDVGGKSSLGGRSRSLMAMSLGGDFLRSWFLVADGETPRPWLSPTEREGVHYISGRARAIVLHLDLDPTTGVRGMSRPSEPEAGFAGAAVLKDLLDERPSENIEELIVHRFRVARLVGQVVEQDCVFPSHLEAQIPVVRRELAERASMSGEEPAWEAVLRALAAEDLRALGDAALALAKHAEAAGHDWSFAQLSSWAYDLAVASRSPATALAAADAMAAACAKVSDSDAATHWLRVRRSLELAQEDAPAVERPLE